MRVILLSCSILLVGSAFAQPFAIGNTTRSWLDTGRNRSVTADVHYPAVTAGNDQPSAAGSFPVLVMGHGFVMGVDAYVYLWQHFVPLGYIVVLPTTEGGFAPDHANFGLDLDFAAQSMQAENSDGMSLFFGHVQASAALMGHSMGGGASFLGASGNPNIQAVVNFAAAETNPSAIAAASGVQVPTLVFAGSEDCVAPIGTNQQPMYDALNVPCKALVTISGGGHCYFGDSNFACTFGELTCNPNLAITRAEQHSVVTDLTTLWLDHYLRGDAAALIAFSDSLSTSQRISAQSACLSTAMGALEVADEVSLWPVPASGMLNSTGFDVASGTVIIDATGRPVLRSKAGAMDVSSLANGIYRILGCVNARPVSHMFVISR